MIIITSEFAMIINVSMFQQLSMIRLLLQLKILMKYFILAYSHAHTLILSILTYFNYKS